MKNNDIVLETTSFKKIRFLSALSQTGISLQELRILYLYFSRMSFNELSDRSVSISRTELLNALDITEIKRDDLFARLRRLYSPIVITDSSNKYSLPVFLFQDARIEVDKSGRCNIKLACTDAALEYFSDIDESVDARISTFTSKYSFFIYFYLKANLPKTSWIVKLNELKSILNCDKQKAYNDFKMFNNKVLKLSHKEITENTNMRFSYELIRKGRFVNAIRFNFEPEDTNNGPELAEQTTEKTGERKNG